VGWVNGMDGWMDESKLEEGEEEEGRKTNKRSRRQVRGLDSISYKPTVYCQPYPFFTLLIYMTQMKGYIQLRHGSPDINPLVRARV